MKTSSKISLGVIFTIALLSALAIIFINVPSKTDAQTSGTAYSGPTFKAASSTAYTLTTTSVRVLATSTPTKRVTTIFQAVNCSAGSSAVFLNMGSDTPAVANTGTAVYASSTLSLQDYPNTPVVQNAVEAVMSQGTCTLLVTEYRTQF